jgi:DNA-directed RNA polymerase subunit M/transcription elongation factor TFIIS
MQFTCPECDQKLKLADTLAGKKTKCPECGKSINVPGKSTALKKNMPAAKKARQRAEDDDESAVEEPAKKGGMGLILGLVGCAVLLVCLVFPAGGFGVWFFGFRKPAEVQQVKKDDEKPKDDPQPIDKDIKVALANGRAERVGEKFEVSVDLDVVDPKANDLIDVVVTFPSDPKVALTVMFAKPATLGPKKKATWTGKFFSRSRLREIRPAISSPASPMTKGISRTARSWPGSPTCRSRREARRSTSSSSPTSGSSPKPVPSSSARSRSTSS